MSGFIAIPRLMEGIAQQCTLWRKVTQALEQNSERSAESKRLGAAHGAPDPILVPLALAHRSVSYNPQLDRTLRQACSGK